MLTCNRSRRYSTVNLPRVHHMCPPLPRSLRDRIRQGKFVMFDKLLLPHNVPPTQKDGKGKAEWPKRHVVDLSSWLETGTDTCVRLAYDHSMALELVKYQTKMVMLFANHPSAHRLEYENFIKQLHGTLPCAGIPVANLGGVLGVPWNPPSGWTYY